MTCPEYKRAPDGPECDTCGEIHSASTPPWVTADGQRLQIADMTDRHLKNCIAMIERCSLTEMRIRLRDGANRIEAAGWLWAGKYSDPNDHASFMDNPYDGEVERLRHIAASNNIHRMRLTSWPAYPYLKHELRMRSLR